MENYGCLYQLRKAKIKDRSKITLWLIASKFSSTFNQQPGDYIDNLTQIGDGVKKGFLAKFPTVSVQDSAGNPAQVQSSFTVDVDAFEIVQTIPTDSATEVDPLKEISVTFNRSVDAESVNLSAFQLRCLEDGQTISGTLTTTDATVTFLPDATLLPAMEYALTIRGGDDGVKDTAGKTLSNDIEVRFRTNSIQSEATHLTIDAPEQAPVNGVLQVTVSARDANERLVSTYSGAVHFSSTDVAAVLPDDYTFHRGDLGRHIFTVTFSTKGAQTITVEDADNGVQRTVG